MAASTRHGIFNMFQNQWRQSLFFHAVQVIASYCEAITDEMSQDYPEFGVHRYIVQEHFRICWCRISVDTEPSVRWPWGQTEHGCKAVDKATSPLGDDLAKINSLNQDLPSA